MIVHAAGDGASEKGPVAAFAQNAGGASSPRVLGERGYGRERSRPVLRNLVASRLRRDTMGEKLAC